MRSIKIIVFGTPVPQGSKSAFYIPKLKRAVIVENNKKTKPWRQQLVGAAIEAMDKQALPMAEGIPIGIKCAFYFDKPKSTKKSVTEKITKPDWDKLARNVCDSLTGVAYKDDSMIVEAHVQKRFDSRPRAEITVEFLSMAQLEG